MTLDEEIAAEIQKLDPSSVIELFELDSTELGGEIFRFHNGTNKLSQNIVWQGEEYIRFPIQVTGFDTSGQGQFPRPTVIVSNVMSTITTILLQYGDLLRSKFTRKRTLLKYLDAVNFPGGVNPSADDTVFIPDDIFYVDRKVSEDRDQVQFELSSAADLTGVQVPKRVIIQSVCPWEYRSAECSFTGIPLYDANDNEIPAPTGAEAIAMMAAWDSLQSAKSALTVAQAALVTAANNVTAAEQYSTETRYQDRSGNSTRNFVVSYLMSNNKRAFWNNVEVSLGTTYTQGEFVESGLDVSTNPGNFYRIVKHTRDEAALTTAIGVYDAALIARDAAQDAVDAAQVTFDAALAAVPTDDPTYRADKCGKRITSCKLRFGATNPLPFGGFPGVAR